MTNSIKSTIWVTLPFLFVLAIADDSNAKIYNEDADAKADIAAAVQKAKAENKHVLVKIGGNWCGWCKILHKVFRDNGEIATALKTNYVLVHVNYSKKNKNPEIMKTLGYPQRFGFPVLVVLDGKGSRIHTQNSVYLEEGKGYDSAAILRFLKNWSPKALQAPE